MFNVDKCFSYVSNKSDNKVSRILQINLTNLNFAILIWTVVVQFVFDKRHAILVNIVMQFYYFIYVRSLFKRSNESRK